MTPTRYNWSLGRAWRQERKLGWKNALGVVAALACVWLLYVWAGVMQP
jgi:hypothetical protein